MKYIVIFILFLATACQSPDKALKEQDPVDFVNPFIGTGGEMGVGFGNMFPGAAYPFGMIQLSPDNGGHSWMYCAGYRYADSTIVGFSHTHLSGTGVADFCDISLMPTTKPIEKKYFVQEDETVNKIIKERGLNPRGFIRRNGHPGPFDKHFLLKYSSGFSHDEEKASPGYYRVNLKDDDIDVELTASEFVGMHRYRFNQKANGQSVILNLGFTNSDQTTDAMVRYRSPELFTGYRFSTGKASVQRVYFAMQFSRGVKNHQFYLNEELQENILAKGKETCVAFLFDDNESDELIVKVAISSVSEEGALANLKTAESMGFDFDKMYLANREKWNDELSKIKITGSDLEKKTIFYTSLYHSYIAPYRFSDVDGNYKNFNHKTGKAEDYTHYTLLSLWDTFRALNPLLSLMQPQVEEDIIHSMLAKFRQTGELPYWEISGNEGGSMIGYHAASLMADAVNKGIGNYNLEELFDALTDVSERDRKGLVFYREFHYVPTDEEKSGTVSKTLEYAFDDWCIAQVAKTLGKEKEYKKYLERSQYYKNLFDPEYHLFRGKNSDGSWYEPFHPRFAEYGNPHCVEGNTWQYSFFAPHDMPGLIELMGGEKGMEMMLDSLFNQTSELLGEDTEDVTGLIGQYAHGNEPSHHVAYLYNFVGKPEKTQYFTNKIINELYLNTPEGLCGNEDCGQMSAWYVFSALGVYPVNPVNGKYWFGSPQFEKAEMELPNGKTFTVIAKNISSDNIYIKEAKLNGVTLERPYVTYNELQQGGTLEFEMTNKTK
ncbi:GH92 family glycosyl hydrolase [Prolixibacteraceae bacterium Z1-6]|uniref:GH92 family glycosyl hydrolase n=1 Tax=Draconibacterium aestuarii TaxID=2998507 RepID=A0A9X3F2N1_9BACT|nr:GH92 family glycosyl hydrolase [Prolixibacteraceae bacterium Z1-6]